MRLRASGDILRRRRLRPAGVAGTVSATPAAAAVTAAPARDAFAPTLLRSCAACAVSDASRCLVSRISRSIPPSAHPINSADRISTSFGFFRGLPLAIYLREPVASSPAPSLSYVHDRAPANYRGASGARGSLLPASCERAVQPRAAR